MKRFALVLALALCAAPYAHADTCTGSVAVTTASTKILSASDVAGGRHFLLLQNIGGEDVYCTIGETATTSKGYKLLTVGNGSLLLQSYIGPNGVTFPVPTGQVNCIAASEVNSVVTACDY